MIIEQIYTGCLAEASYYIESNGEAVIIDPLRESEPYLEKLAKANVKLKYIFETHFHADFVSGHLDLAKKTGATIVYGPDANPDFEVLQVTNGAELSLGDLTFKVLHTPGHTLECVCYLLNDKDKKPYALFTGDTLFIGDVGRPDLAIDNGLSKVDLAKMLFQSLREKVMVLPDDIIIYPAHGAGSSCGKNMSKERFDTLGNQKKTNYALRTDMTEDEFIKEVLEGMPPPPEYFAFNAMLNKSGYEALDKIIEKGMTALSVEDFDTIGQKENVVTIDTRHQQIFKDGFVPGSLFFGLKGSFAPWVGSVLKDINTKIIFIADAGTEKEVITRLSRVGFDHVLGFLEGGFETWKNVGKPIDKITSISALAFANRLSQTSLNILDVRKPGEYESSHIQDAVNSPLDYIGSQISALENKEYYIHCAGGYRSMIYASMMKKMGHDQVIEIAGGYGAIRKEDGFIKVESHCSL